MPAPEVLIGLACIVVLLNPGISSGFAGWIEGSKKKVRRTLTNIN